MSKVYLAVGHGRRADGTVDPGATLGSATEQNQGAPIVAAAAERLRDRGVTVKAQRAGDPNVIGHTTEANEWGADLAVSVHHDWHKAPRGAFGFWHPNSPEGGRLADNIYAAVSAAGFPMRPSWHRPHSSLHFLNNTRMPAVLWECDRVGSVEDHVRYGRALADGILRHLDIKPTPSGSDDIKEADMAGRLVHIGKRGGIAYEYDNKARTLYPVPSSDFAEAITGDSRWHRHTVVVSETELGRRGVRVAS